MPEFMKTWLENLSETEKSELADWIDGDPECVGEILDIIDPEVM